MRTVQCVDFPQTPTFSGAPIATCAPTATSVSAAVLVSLLLRSTPQAVATCALLVGGVHIIRQQARNELCVDCTERVSARLRTIRERCISQCSLLCAPAGLDFCLHASQRCVNPTLWFWRNWIFAWGTYDGNSVLL